MKNKHKELKLTKIIPRFDEEELKIGFHKFPAKGISLTDQKTEIRLKLDCLVRDKSILFELDFLFGSGQIVTLTFARDCSNFIPVKQKSLSSKNMKKQKKSAKKNEIKTSKSVKIEDLSIQIQATNVGTDSGFSLFGFIWGEKT